MYNYFLILLAETNYKKLKDGFKGERYIVLPPYVVGEITNGNLSKELYITDIGYYPQAKFHFCSRTKEEAERYILIYCVEGEGWFTLNKTKYKVERNQFFILPKGCEHSYGSNTKRPWTIYWLHFDGVHSSFFAEGFDRPTFISPGTNSRIEYRINLFDEIFNTLSKGYSMQNISYVTVSLFHFLGSIKFLGEYRENSGQIEKSQVAIDEVIHYMRENIGHKLTLNDLAKHVGLSPSHFSLLFQKRTGHSPLNYFNQLKIQKACHLLDFSELKINQISPIIGFEDAFYFTRMFTKVMGESPSEYRLKKKG